MTDDSRPSPGDALSLWYRTPAASVAGLLRRGLEPVLRGPWAFWNVLLTRLDAPRADATYHLLVQAMDDRAELLRGLYSVHTELGGATVRLEDGGAPRPADSCFPTLLDARRTLAQPPLRLAASWGEGGDDLVLSRVTPAPTARETPVRIGEARLDYLDAMGQLQRILELATRLSPAPPGSEWAERRRLLAGGPLQHEGTPRGHRPRPVAARNREHAVPVTPS